MLIGQARIAVSPYGLGERRGHIRGEAQHLAHFADRPARAIVNDGGADGGALASIALVDILDDVLAPFMFEIDVDVGGLVALLRDETGEQKLARPGIDRSDAEAVADGAVGRRAASLAEDVVLRQAG